MQRVHILGVGGTFMAPLAVLAREAGFRVTASDCALYQPMQSFLERENIKARIGTFAQLPEADLYIVGNVATRSHPEVEWLLSRRKPMLSAPAFLRQHLLGRRRQLVAVAGTHGKTSVSAMLVEILEKAGMQPGFLIGGVRRERPTCALGSGPFVIEADEYDSAFFDKRSKFVHFFPDLLAINNIEFDHADIFADLTAIETQFHHVVRTMPADAHIVASRSPAVERVLQRGLYCPVTWIGKGGWQVSGNTRQYVCSHPRQGEVVVDADSLVLAGEHQRANVAMALALAVQLGVAASNAARYIEGYAGVVRRLDKVADTGELEVYEDFAHHPTAIRATCQALQSRLNKEVLALVVLATNSFASASDSGRLKQLIGALPAGSRIVASDAQVVKLLNDLAGHKIATKKLQTAAETLTERAKAKGVAIVVCTNRASTETVDALRRRIKGD